MQDIGHKAVPVTTYFQSLLAITKPSEAQNGHKKVQSLLNCAESLGGLQLDRNTPLVRVKQSVDTAYYFPPQDTKLKVGDKPRIAEMTAYAGIVAELSAEDGRVVLRPKAKSGDMPERLSLVPAPIDMQNVPNAVLAFAERPAQGLTQADQASLDSLCGCVPRESSLPMGIASCANCGRMRSDCFSSAPIRRGRDRPTDR
jgi:hypothetical protein